ncbi:hypothetical protein Acr_08g0015460 [Actinidia rufa]|uniref:Uncharacterized protein n=1 Tax=Actinidia rufa TaxID=165716 RepID=A0A7J0F389_9ERIC|nr:hypothetical protein Acr_08g0015460 [Actinidia rufa]
MGGGKRVIGQGDKGDSGGAMSGEGRIAIFSADSQTRTSKSREVSDLYTLFGIRICSRIWESPDLFSMFLSSPWFGTPFFLPDFFFHCLPNPSIAGHTTDRGVPRPWSRGAPRGGEIPLCPRAGEEEPWEDSSFGGERPSQRSLSLQA